jgi:hypothetical protein
VLATEDRPARAGVGPGDGAGAEGDAGRGAAPGGGGAAGGADEKMEEARDDTACGEAVAAEGGDVAMADAGAAGAAGATGGRTEAGAGAGEAPAVLYYACEGAKELLPEGEVEPTRGKDGPASEAENRAEQNRDMKEQAGICSGLRAKFMLSHWEKFAAFMPPASRATDSPLALKLRQAADKTPADTAGAGKRPVVRQPDCIVSGEMHPYQLDGLKWLVAQHDKGAGGILGDEMGLGKTLQVISLLGFLKSVRGEGGPHIVVAPLSVMNSWVTEMRKWCPLLRVVPFHGPQTERERIKREFLTAGKFDVMCTTYEMLVADIHTCQRFRWGYIVLDEAHRVKNEKSLMGQAVRRLRSSHRLMITGTPLQNNMHELWSLLNFLYPEVL